MLVVVDGVGGKKYDGFLTGSKLVFDTSQSLRALAVQGRDILRVEITIKTETASRPAAAQKKKRIVSDERATRIRLSLRGNSIYAGQMPFIIGMHDSKGNPPASGFGGAVISSSFNNVLLDMSDLPKIGNLGLAMQVDRNGLDVASISLSTINCRSVFIDEEGIAFPNELREIEEPGPFIAIMFESTDGRVLRAREFHIDVKGEAQNTSYSHRLRKFGLFFGHGKVVVDSVRREPIVITITDKATSEKTWTGTVFPQIRGATPEFVVYKVKTID